MRHFLLSLLPAAVLCAACSVPKPLSPSLEMYELHGPVLSCRTETFEAESKFGTVVQGEPVSICYFGNVNHDALFDPDGHIVRFTTFFAGYEDTFVTPTRDADGNVTELQFFNCNGNLTGRVAARYENGLLCSVERYTDYYTDFMSFEYECGLIAKETSYAEDTVAFSSKYLYDKGNLVAIESSNADGITERLDAAYDEAGRIVSITDGEVTFTVEYNEFGLPSRSSKPLFPDMLTPIPLCAQRYSDTLSSLFAMSDEVDGTFTYEYEFDESGNWIRRTVFAGEDKTPVYITTRKIKYYAEQ